MIFFRIKYFIQEIDKLNIEKNKLKNLKKKIDIILIKHLHFKLDLIIYIKNKIFQKL